MGLLGAVRVFPVLPAYRGGRRRCVSRRGGWCRCAWHSGIANCGAGACIVQTRLVIDGNPAISSRAAIVIAPGATSGGQAVQIHYIALNADTAAGATATLAITGLIYPIVRTIRPLLATGLNAARKGNLLRPNENNAAARRAIPTCSFAICPRAAASAARAKVQLG